MQFTGGKAGETGNGKQRIVNRKAAEWGDSDLWQGVGERFDCGLSRT